MLDDFEANAKVFFHPLLKFALIPTIRPDQLEARQFSDKSSEHHLAPFPIRDISRKHFDGDHQALRIHHQMPFSAPDFFSPRRSLSHRHGPDWF